jgi:hypothetical protein
MNQNEFSTLCRSYKDRDRGFFGSGKGCLLAALAGLGLVCLLVSRTGLRPGWWVYLVCVVGFLIAYQMVVDRLLFAPLRRRLEQVIADYVCSRVETCDERNCIEVSLRGLPHGHDTRFVIGIGGELLTVVDRPRLGNFISSRDTFAVEGAVSVVNEPVDEKTRKELASMLAEVPREGSLKIDSMVKDGMPAIMRVVRDGQCHEFKCNYAGIPEQHQGAIQVRLLLKIVGLSHAWSRGRGVGTCDKEGKVQIFTGRN